MDVKNTAEMIIYTAEKALKDNEAKIPADVKDNVNAKITVLRDVKDLPAGEGGINIEAIKKQQKSFLLKCLKLVKL